jgi:hypothetical protein
MTLVGYVDILNTMVKPWLNAKEDFILKEDRDSRYSIGKKNIVREWKEVNSLKLYFNCYNSPDLAPIKNY